jgi:hypothetical protein
MRKISSVLLASFLLLSLNSCGSKTETETTIDTTTSIPADATVNAIEEVSGDKEKLRQTLVIAASKGTLQAALTEAAQDSIVRDQLRAALAAAGGNARTASAASSSSRRSSSTSASQTPAQKKDALDQANDAIDKTTRTIDRTNETVNKANEAARKADELLRRK